MLLWNAKFILLLLYTIFTYIYKEKHRNRNGIKVEEKQKSFFSQPQTHFILGNFSVSE